MRGRKPVRCWAVSLAVLAFVGMAIGLGTFFYTDVADFLRQDGDVSVVRDHIVESDPISTSGVVGDRVNKDYKGTILISLDGFRHDYLDRGITPNLDLIVRGGVRAKRMTSQFPSKTFTNHWSIITGLYPETHGIIDNEFYDPATGEKFTNKIPKHFNDPKWWHGDPLWSTVKSQNEISASMFWVGNAIRDKKRGASLSEPYDSRVSLIDRVKEVRLGIG